MIGIRLFFAQFRAFWRLRARLSDLRLDLFRRRFALRSWASAEAGSSTAVLHIGKLTLLDLTLAAILALLLWWLNPFFDSARLTVSDAAYVELLGTIAAIGGVFIGLYYAALTAAMTAVYAQMPNTVRQLLMQERFGNAYMRFVATVTFLSLILLLLQTLGIRTTAGAAPLLTLASGVAVFGFVKLGNWAFRLFDPTAVSHSVFRGAYLMLKQVAVGGYQWRSPAFQHFAQRRGAHARPPRW